MRPNQNKRMRGRNNRRGPNPLTRAYESNGPDVKIRGTAAHIAEKYVQLARDAHASGDPVSAENHLQHAEHYYRLIAAAHLAQAQQQPGYVPTPQQAAEAEELDDDDFDGGLSDRFTFRPPQSFQPENGNGAPQAGGQPRQDGGREGGRDPRQQGEGRRDGQRRDERAFGGSEQPYLDQPGEIEAGEGGERAPRPEGFRDRDPQNGNRFDRRERRDFGGQRPPREGDRPFDRPRDGERGERFGGDRPPRGEERPDRPAPAPVAAQPEPAGELALPSFITQPKRPLATEMADVAPATGDAEGEAAAPRRRGRRKVVKDAEPGDDGEA
jgi:hypothetical protein